MIRRPAVFMKRDEAAALTSVMEWEEAGREIGLSDAAMVMDAEETWKTSCLHTTCSPLHLYHNKVSVHVSSYPVCLTSCFLSLCYSYWGQMWDYYFYHRHITRVQCFFTFTVVGGCAVSTFPLLPPHSPAAYYSRYHSPGPLNWPAAQKMFKMY